MGLSPASGDHFYIEFLCMLLGTNVSMVVTMSKEFENVANLLCTVLKYATICM